MRRITAFNINTIRIGAVVYHQHLVSSYIYYPLYSTYVLLLYAGRPLVCIYFFFGSWAILVANFPDVSWSLYPWWGRSHPFSADMGIVLATALCSRTRFTGVVFEVHFGLIGDHRLASGNCHSFGPRFPSVSLMVGPAVTSFYSERSSSPISPSFVVFNGEICLLLSYPTLPDRGGVLEISPIVKRSW